MITLIKHYPDNGCELSPKCLECSLPSCILDDMREKVRALKLKRNLAFRELVKQGKTLQEIANIYGVSVHTVQRGAKLD